MYIICTYTVHIMFKLMTRNIDAAMVDLASATFLKENMAIVFELQFMSSIRLVTAWFISLTVLLSCPIDCDSQKAAIGHLY